MTKEIDHASRAHAKLAPSSMGRVMKCPGSVVMCDGIVQNSSVFAEEGTLAHEAAELFGRALVSGEIHCNTYESFDDDMLHYAQGYAEFLKEKLTKFNGGKAPMFEQRLKYSEDIWGTIDFLSVKEVNPKEFDLLIVDYKYGMGVAVSAEGNAQLKTYAACAERFIREQFPNARLRKAYAYIYQPRTPGDDYNRAVYTGEDIRAWGKALDNITEVVELAYEHGPEKYLNAQGLDHCRFCAAKTNCKAYLKESKKQLLVHIDAEEPKVPDVESLTMEQKVNILKVKKSIETYLKDVEHSLMEAAKAGEKIPGYKIVAGQSRRVWIDDEKTILKTLKDLGCKRAYRRSLITLGEAEKQIEGTKKEIAEKLAPLVTKTVPKHQLTTIDDKRKEVLFLDESSKISQMDDE